MHDPYKLPVICPLVSSCTCSDSDFVIFKKQLEAIVSEYHSFIGASWIAV